MLSITLNKTKAAMAEAGISTQVLAKLAGTSASTLSAALRDVGYLGSEKEAALHSLVLKISEYRDALAPLPLPDGVEDLAALLNSNVSPADVRELVNKIFGRG